MEVINIITELKEIAYKKLVEYTLIDDNEIIELIPNYTVTLNNRLYTHFIINCIYSNKKFFLKVFKNRDNIFQCNDYLLKINENIGHNKYPTILVPRFKFNDVEYYISSFIDGESLDNISVNLSEEQCRYIANEIQKQWIELTKTKSNIYSEKGEYLKSSASDIFKNKLKNRLKHPVFDHISKEDKNIIHYNISKTIEKCSFSEPSLIHMDVKPANIVYNIENHCVTLIDFEHARFGDIDFGWVQILLSGYNLFGETYENYIYPYIIKDRISFSEAFKTPKLRCYIFYQSACNLIYYYEKNLECPSKIKECFNILLNDYLEEN